VGGGSGGLAAAQRAAQHGAKVALCDFVTPSPQGTTWGLGGTCVNVGCIPKKLMHRAALLGEDLHDAESFGWPSARAEGAKVDWDALVTTVTNYIRGLNFQYNVALRSKNVAYLNAYATFADPHTVVATDKKGVEKRLSARRILLAPGGRPTPLPCPGHEHCIDSDDLFRLKRDPGRTLVVGASYIGLECAGFLKGIGREPVVMMRSIPLRGMDTDMAERVVKFMEERANVPFIRGAVPSRIEAANGREGPFKVTWTMAGREVTKEFDTVLAAVGRKTALGNTGVDTKAGVAIGGNGRVPTDAADRTNVPHIYCIGDAAEGRPELTPVAIQAGRLLADRLYAKGKSLMDYDNVPTTVFTPLEYAFVGLSEEAAAARYGGKVGEKYEVYHQGLTPLEWQIAKERKEAQNECFVKLVVEKASDKVVGFHVLAPNAGEICQGVAVALKAGATKRAFDTTVGIHPTVAESMVDVQITKSSGASTATSGGC